MGVKTSYRVLLLALVAGAFALTAGASPAGAAGYISSARQTVYTDFIHYRVGFEVYDGRGYCVEDEYGFYNDFDCMDYDDNRATVDIVVYRMRKTKRPRIVYSDRLYGSRGRATEDLYVWQLNNNDSCPSPPTYYRAVFRLRDPITDRIVDTQWKRFSLHCS
jgi:hypothetical protein